MVGLGVSPAEAESVGGGDVRRGEAVLPRSAEGPGSGPGLAGLRSPVVGSAGTGREDRDGGETRLGHDSWVGQIGAWGVGEKHGTGTCRNAS
jgi:hypothetical protein